MRKWTNVSFIQAYEVALSNQSGVGLLCKCAPGGEACRLFTNTSDLINNETYIITNVTTLDKFIEDHNISRTIDLLKIDAEGFDPLVIQGADGVLNRHQVRLFLFEYHGVGMWSATSLQEVVTNLDKKGYMCYQLGQTGIFRLTRCWSSRFEKRTWSNVICVSRRESKIIFQIEKLLIKF